MSLEGNFKVDELFAMAHYASMNRRFDDAIVYLKQAINQSEASSGLYLALASEYANIGLLEYAIETYDTSLSIEPTLWIALLKKAALLLSVNEIELANQSLSSLLELPQDNEYYYFGKGLKLLIDGDTRSAIDSFSLGCDMTNNYALSIEIEALIQSILEDERQNEKKQEEVHASNSDDSKDEDSTISELSAYKLQ